MLRIATIEDLDVCVEMGMKFAEASPYSKYTDKEYITNLITGILNASNEESIILLYEDYGMIGASKVPFPFGPISVATEIAWWVDPEHRNKKVGKELKDAIEFWAQKVGCTIMTMITLDEKLGAYYEKDGYTLAERAYIKEL